MLEYFRSELLNTRRLADREIAALRAELLTAHENITNITNKIGGAGSAADNFDRSWAFQQISSLEKDLMHAISRPNSVGSDKGDLSGNNGNAASAATSGKPPLPQRGQVSAGSVNPKPSISGSLQVVTSSRRPSGTSGAAKRSSVVAVSMVPADKNDDSILTQMRLHKPADNVAMGVLRADKTAVELAEALVQFLGSWSDGLSDESMAGVKALELLCSNQEEAQLVHDLKELVGSHPGAIPLPALEIFEKLEGILELSDEYAEAAIRMAAGRGSMKRLDSAISMKPGNLQRRLSKSGSATPSNQGSGGSPKSRGQNSWQWSQLALGASAKDLGWSSSDGKSGKSSGGHVPIAESQVESALIGVSSWREKAQNRLNNRKGREELMATNATHSLKRRPSIMSSALKVDMGTQTAFDMDLTFDLIEEEDEESCYSLDSWGEDREQFQAHIPSAQPIDLNREIARSQSSDKVSSQIVLSAGPSEDLSNLIDMMPAPMHDDDEVKTPLQAKPWRSEEGDGKEAGTSAVDVSAMPQSQPLTTSGKRSSRAKMSRSSSKRFGSRSRTQQSSTKKVHSILPPFYLIYLGETGELELSPGVVLCTKVDNIKLSEILELYRYNIRVSLNRCYYRHLHLLLCLEVCGSFDVKKALRLFMKLKKPHH